MSETASGNVIPERIENGDFLFQLSSLSRNALPEGYPAEPGFEEALFLWAGKHLPADRLDLFRSLFSVEELKKAFEDGKTSCSFDYDDPKDDKLSRRLVLHMLSDADSGDLLCVSTVKSFPRDVSGEDIAADSSPFRAVIRSYRLFFAVDPDSPQILRSSVYRDLDGLAGTASLPCSFRSFLKAVSARYVRPAWEEEFLSTVSLDQLRAAMDRKQAILTHTFSSDQGPLRVDVYLPDAGDSDRRCYFGLGGAGESAGNSLAVSPQDSAAMHAAYEDLHLAMQMEREETRKKHRRRSVLLALFMIVAGLLGGSLLMQKVPDYAAVLSRVFPTSTPEPVAVTPPPPEEAAEVVVPDTVVEYVPFTREKAFTADLMANGLPRDGVHNADDETLTVTLSVPELLTPEWFALQYAKSDYTLDGTENGVHLVLSFTGGKNLSSLLPQDSFPLRLVDANGNTVTGYQLTDQPIDGKYGVKVTADTLTDLYKRCEGIETARYLVLSCWQDGVPHEYRFSLRYDDPNVDYERLKSGDKGDEVLAMKQKLVSLGYLGPNAVKNNVFNKDVVNAVKAAQEAFGLEKTGEADTAFLKELYSH